jgi:hypothetical protein
LVTKQKLPVLKWKCSGDLLYCAVTLVHNNVLYTWNGQESKYSILWYFHHQKHVSYEVKGIN